ncbi:MAG: MFS transporter [Rhodococcus sp.]|nr:MFS transporter [Rhodococcus sp. (in: high G+C Gram-positive bacteria)]
MLTFGMFAQMAQAILVNGVAFLIPTLQDDHGLSLARTGIVVAAPTIGVMTTLVLWGGLADRFGERRVLATGLALAAASAAGAALSPSLPWMTVLLVLGGMAAASANAASGRVVVGWFPPQRRGLAMGIRQMSLPLGIACAAMVIPPVAETYGIGWALAFPTLVCAIAAATSAFGIVDPPRPERSEAANMGLLDNPYRTSSTLWRIHASSVLLVVPQYTVWTYALVWLISERGWDATAAGILITVSQLLGAAGRISVGYWSDRVGSRLRPMRWVAATGAALMLTLAVTDGLELSVAVVVMVAASIATVAPNGLAFTAVAEIAGPFWGGRALGIQNTGQFVAASIVPPVFGAIIGAVSFPLAFGIAAAFPAAAIPVVPAEPKRESS